MKCNDFVPLPHNHCVLGAFCDVCVCQTNFDIATQIPLIIRAAGQTQGRVVDTIIEAVDVYPTLASLAGELRLMFSSFFFVFGLAFSVSCGGR